MFLRTFVVASTILSACAYDEERGVENGVALVQLRATPDCDAAIPRYDMAKWIEEHGPDGVLPDHPAVFRGGPDDLAGMKGYGKYTTFSSFLEKFGEERVHVRPEYSQAGGVGSQFATNLIQESTLREVASSWNSTHRSMGIFVCQESSLCQKTMPNLQTPALFKGKTSSINFLIGGPGSGLVVHEHGKTWQGLFAGRKAWYLMPPEKMTAELIDLTSPFLMPPRAWEKKARQLPLGKRPLYCVQHPGEIMYFPDRWYHGTMNLDEFQLAWGAKPVDRPQQTNSKALTKIMTYFNQDGAVDQPEFPSCLDMRVSEYQRSCSEGSDTSLKHLDEPLQKLRSLALSPEGRNNTALTETVSAALCWTATKMSGVDEQKCPGTSLLAQKWIAQSAEVTPTRKCEEF